MKSITAPNVTLRGVLGTTLLLLSVPAWAQTTGTTSADKGTCEGMVGMQAIQGTTYVTVGKEPIMSNAGYVYSRAECECKTTDLGMRILMTTPIPSGTSGVGAEAWVGASDCTSSTNRTQTGSICEKSDSAVSVSSFMSTAAIDIAFSSEKIPNPKTVNWMPTPDKPVWPYSCDVNGTSTRTLYVLLGDVSGSPASCKMPVTVDTTPPPEPQNVSAASGDSAITMRWEAPTGDNSQDIEYYQILCRRPEQPTKPVKDSAFLSSVRYYYSVCLNGQMYRRPPPTQAANQPEHPTDGIPAASADPKDTPFSLHPAFICSDRVQAMGASSFSTRVDGLTNGVAYQLAVVAIDRNGNPSTPKTLLTATPQQVANPFAQYCEGSGDCPTGLGCSLSAARPTPSYAPWLALWGLPLILRRRRSVRGGLQPSLRSPA